MRSSWPFKTSRVARGRLGPSSGPSVALAQFHRFCRYTLVVGLVCLTACGCGASPSEPAGAAARSAPSPPDSMPDIHSFARPADARVTHVALDLRADFEARRLVGSARLSLTRRPGAKEIVL